MTDKKETPKNGCCVDGDCTPETCMDLPKGKTCNECQSIRKCLAMFGAESKNDHCQFFPRRFYTKAGPGATLKGALDKMKETGLADSAEWAAARIKELEAKLGNARTYICGLEARILELENPEGCPDFPGECGCDYVHEVSRTAKHCTLDGTCDLVDPGEAKEFDCQGCKRKCCECFQEEDSGLCHDCFCKKEGL